MRKKNQKIRRSTGHKGEAHRGDPITEIFRCYRVSGDGLSDVLIFGRSASEAERVARRIYGVTKCYLGYLEVREAAEGELLEVLAAARAGKLGEGIYGAE